MPNASLNWSAVAKNASMAQMTEHHVEHVLSWTQSGKKMKSALPRERQDESKSSPHSAQRSADLARSKAEHPRARHGHPWTFRDTLQCNAIPCV